MKYIDEHLEEVLIVLLLAAMAGLVCVQVIMRYVFSASLVWSDEASRYAFIWMTYLGVAYGVKKSAHVNVTVVLTALPEWLRPWFRIISLLLIGVFAFLVVTQGWLLVEKLLRFGQKSASLGIPMAWIYMAPVVGFGLVFVRLAQALWGEIHALRNGAAGAAE
ncbi:TRAP transporter small permease [Vreelandella aquamarina]|uniref:TRAP transporter small permease n=1 Tax=Vreelandella aquamarina TaxID=77097 RepID=UPI001D181934|nr:TRAP transporter small permease [Halomonas meridiana]MCC4289284.1 TRAP transporter small permease [Halomonas meridiana]